MLSSIIRLVFQLAVILIVAKTFGCLFTRYLKQPRVLGEVIAGMVIGPYALGGMSIPLIGKALFPLNGSHGTLPVSMELYSLAAIASVVLLFRAGLETDLSLFAKYSLVGTGIGVGGVVVSFALGDLIAVWWGVADSFLDPPALFLGTVSTATSVGITARILSENRKMSSPEGVTILSGAVLDDVLGMVVLAVVVSVSQRAGSSGGPGWRNAAGVAGKALGLWIGCSLLGILLAPRLTRLLKWFKSNDVIAATAFGVALFLAGLFELAGLAMIIGAYVAGFSLARTDVVHEIHERLSGVYQFFVPVFFCVMGMMVDFSALMPVLLFGCVYTAAAVAGKFFGCGLPALALGFNARGAARIGAGMLPRGEVTMIVAGIGLSSGIIGRDLFGVAVMALFISSIIAPGLISGTFSGGTGVRGELAGRKQEETDTIVMDFPSREVCHFMRLRVEQAFRNEEFFVHRLDMDRPMCQMRKEDIVITLTEEQSKLVLNTARKNSHLARMILLEEIVELKDLLDKAQNTKGMDSLESEFVRSLFAGE
ncbi:MAG: cation:proton antiporter [Kiritimatiellia bacterium]